MGIIEKMRLDGKAIYVTGAASGIGKCAATAFAEAGADVAIVDINYEGAKKVAEEIREATGSNTIAISCDVTDPEQVEAMVAKVVETYGGGICQVSTTLYNAVLYAELEVVKRFPHSMLVAYVDPSRDAAIAGDTKDFVFKNNYENPIYIEGEITADNQLTFRIYGKETRSENRSVEYESETTATEEYKVIFQDDPTLPAGQKEYEGSPHNGKSARLWKIVKENGKEVSREVINQSEYRRSDEIIRVGTKE